MRVTIPLSRKGVPRSSSSSSSSSSRSSSSRSSSRASTSTNTSNRNSLDSISMSLRAKKYKALRKAQLTVASAWSKRGRRRRRRRRRRTTFEGSLKASFHVDVDIQRLHSTSTWMSKGFIPRRRGYIRYISSIFHAWRGFIRYI